jgi:hypothetical protein
MNMPPPGPPQAAPGGPPPGQPPQQGGQAGPQDNPIVTCIKILTEFGQRLAQRNPQAGKAFAMHLQGLIQAIQGSAGKQPEGAPGEEQSESPAEAAQEPPAEAKSGIKKKMGPMPMNAKPGAKQVL